MRDYSLIVDKKRADLRHLPQDSVLGAGYIPFLCPSYLHPSFMLDLLAYLKERGNGVIRGAQDEEIRTSRMLSRADKTAIEAMGERHHIPLTVVDGTRVEKALRDYVDAVRQIPDVTEVWAQVSYHEPAEV